MPRFGVTVPTRKAGLKVAMIEERDLGGTCPNRGCTPKKVLVAAAHALHEIGQAHVHRIKVGTPKLDWAALIDREKEMIEGIPDSLEETLQGARRRADPRAGEIRRAQHGRSGRQNARGEDHRHRHGLLPTAAADPRRRADDHL